VVAKHVGQPVVVVDKQDALSHGLRVPGGGSSTVVGAAAMSLLLVVLTALIQDLGLLLAGCI